jgi:two-component system sensor histidine kinase YesM
MRKFAYLSARVAAVIVALFLIAALGVFAVFFLGYRSGLLRLSLAWGLPLLVALAGVGVWVLPGLIKPYREAARLQRAFLAEQIYTELFQPVVYLTPEIRQVLERFRYMLSKQEVVSLSKKQAEYLALQNQINPHFCTTRWKHPRRRAGRGAGGHRQNGRGACHLLPLYHHGNGRSGHGGGRAEQHRQLLHHPALPLQRQAEAHRALGRGYRLPCKIPKLTLQPIVENSIFHGLESKSGDGLITIRLEATQSRILISIRDNGVGMSQRPSTDQ